MVPSFSRIPIRKAARSTGSISATRPASRRPVTPSSISRIWRHYLALSIKPGLATLFLDTAPSIGGVNPDLFAIADMISDSPQSHARRSAPW